MTNIMHILHLFAGNIEVDTGTNQQRGQVNIPNIAADNIFLGLLNGFYLLTGAICVVIIIIAGFRYVLSQGDSSAIAKAKNTILYAAVGLVVVAFAFAITQFVTTGVTEGL